MKKKIISIDKNLHKKMNRLKSDETPLGVDYRQNFYVEKKKVYAKVNIKKGDVVLVERPLARIADSMLCSKDVQEEQVLQETFEKNYCGMPTFALLAWKLVNLGRDSRLRDIIYPGISSMNELAQYAKILSKKCTVQKSRKYLKHFLKIVASQRLDANISFLNVPLGSFIFENAGLFSHRCCFYNCNHLIYNDFVVVWARQDICKGDLLTICLMDHIEWMTLADRTHKLQDFFPFRFGKGCKCLDCEKGIEIISFSDCQDEKLKSLIRRMYDSFDTHECEVITRVLLSKYTEILQKHPNYAVYILFMYIDQKYATTLDTTKIMDDLFALDKIVFQFYEMFPNIFNIIDKLGISKECLLRMNATLSFALLQTQSPKALSNNAVSTESCLYLYSNVYRYIHRHILPKEIRKEYSDFIRFLAEKSEKFDKMQTYLQKSVVKKKLQKVPPTVPCQNANPLQDTTTALSAE